MTAELLTDHDLDEAIGLLGLLGAPVRQRITMALDLLGLDGPGVDKACGVVEPAVDRWETGELIPTAEQLARLASLTEQPVSFFFQPARPEPEGWMCIRSGPGKGCHPLRTSDPVAKPAEPPADVEQGVEQLGLFEAPAPLPTSEPLSAGRRRTEKQKATIARGRHPLTGGLAFPGASCGTCDHLTRHGRYLKCGLGPITAGPATDIRRHWPACLRHPAAQAGLESKP